MQSLGKVFVILGRQAQAVRLGKFVLIQTRLNNFALSQILEGTLIITNK